MIDKRRIRRALAREQRQIGRRLEEAVAPNTSGPVIGRANIVYEYSERTKAVAHGGIGLVCRLVGHLRLASEIDASLELLKVHRPYLESDHVLNVAYNALCGGATLDDIEARRSDAVFLDGIRAASLPDPTTAGDFCRRFDPESIMALQEAVNRARLRVWAAQPPAFFAQRAVIDADASIISTDAETKEGMGIAYNGVWGYSALMVNLANTKEPLYFKLFGANRPSHEGSADLYDRAIALVREAGFAEVLLRGDTDYALTANFDRWDGDGVRFVFGYDARPNLVEKAKATDDELYHQLVRRAERVVKTKPRHRPRKVKNDVVRERKYKVLRTTGEDICEFDYRPGACKKDYRVVALRKDLSVERGEDVLFHEYRWFFYITNLSRTTSADDVVTHARQRCDQENLISQLKGQVRALHAPLNTLVANWAYMVMAALAWSIKAWCALLLPTSPRWAKLHNEQRRRLLTMDFKTFRRAFIDIPCQIATGGRQVRWRVLAWNPWLDVFFRLLAAL
jgi:Transposase DDE domain group 1